MATNISRISSARNAIAAVDLAAIERERVQTALDVLERAVVEERIKERKKSAPEVKPPEFLRCAADYQDAPRGTQVAKRFGSGWWMKIDEGWIDESGTVMPGSHIAVAPREVVEWGAV
ncbi:hypothetical protein [Corynebacterium variabile]|uniref:hypothetical protein n=1 Tax=Corynebacterium variabile TaxID=1727 RepID=UPI00289E4798|nr:hypothetical protein [Corynebacterium variabile]